MALPFLALKPNLIRPTHGDDGSISYFDDNLKVYTISSDAKHWTSRMFFNKDGKYTGNGKESITTPPYHYHLYQTESFIVNSGVMSYILDGKEGTLTKGGSVSIPPLVPHTFWSTKGAEEDLDVEITVRGGPNPGFDEHFVRNFYGYLSSQTTSNSPLSPFQMILFLYSADVVLADIPPGLGRVVNFVVGFFFGHLIMGYQIGYKIFDD